MNATLRIGVACLVVVALGGCGPDETEDPPQDSALSAHGNTDWHIDTAEEFLFGTDMAGNSTAANHAPSSWSLSHIHGGLTNTGHFYHDDDLATPGDDADATNGIDTTMLFFYAGHGGPESWDTLGDSAEQGSMLLGDGDDDGLLRYYWQCSCRVFAHGPSACSGTGELYACPEDFDGSADSDTMRNVYERWGDALSSDLRMACGVSTRAYCHESQMNRIWDNYNNDGLDVSDSFIDGLEGTIWPAPLCITTGDTFVSATPLFDETFTNDANPSGPWYHIQFPSEFASNQPEIFRIEPPELLPILELIPRPWPEPILGLDLQEWEGILASDEEVGDRGPRVRVNPASGATYIRGARTEFDATTLSESAYLDRAAALIEEFGWAEAVTLAPVGSTMQLVSTLQEDPGAEVEQVQKNVTVKIRRVVPFEDRSIVVFGEGGLMTVQMSNDGSLLNATKVWRDIEDDGTLAPVKRYDEALEEARAELDDPRAYELDRWYWGYREEAGNVRQDRMLISYWFEFTPVSEDLLRRHPPRLIEIVAQEG